MTVEFKPKGGVKAVGGRGAVEGQSVRQSIDAADHTLRRTRAQRDSAGGWTGDKTAMNVRQRLG